MKEIDIQDMLQYLETQIRGVNLFLANKYDKNKPKKQTGLFDLFESDYNKDITLDKDKVIEMFDNVADKVKDILVEVKQCGIHFEDFKKASSDFYQYCQKNKQQIEENTKRYGEYQHNLFEQIKKNVNKNMLYDFNNTFTEIVVDKYFHDYKRKRGGNTKKQTLFDAIYCEINNLPLHRLNEAFDKKGHFLGINNIPYDTSLLTKEGVNKDTDGKSLFVFQYKRNKYGYFECIRMKFDKEWFILYEEDKK